MSTNTKEVVPPITATSTVPELIKCMWLSFQPPDCSEVEAILINRENELKVELEMLRRDNLRLKEKHDLIELKKSKYESELLVSKTECHELNEKSAKYAQMLLEAKENKYRIVLDFSEKINGLESEKLKMVADLSGKVKVLEGDKLEMEKKTVNLTEELNNEKKMVEEKNQMLLVLEKDKSRIFSELSEKINGLEREKLKMKESYSKLIDNLNDEKKKAEEKVEKERSIIFSEHNKKIQELEREKLTIEKKVAMLIEELVDKKKEKVKKEKSITASRYRKKVCARKEEIKDFDSTGQILIDLTESDDDVTNNEDCKRVIDEQIACPKRKRSQVEGEGVQKLQSLLSSNEGNISGANVRESIYSNKGKLPFIKQCGIEGNAASSNSFVSKDQDNKWRYAPDMLFSFTKDPQLCMNAVSDNNFLLINPSRKEDLAPGE